MIPVALQLATMIPSFLKMFGQDQPAQVVEKVVNIAQSITGTTNPEAAMAALQENEELKQRFLDAAEARALETIKVYLFDVQSARLRDIEIQKIKGSNARADWLVAAAFAGVLLIGLAFILVPNLSADAKTFMATVGGMLTMKIGTAFDFEFGSSKGSDKQKDAILQLTENAVQK